MLPKNYDVHAFISEAGDRFYNRKVGVKDETGRITLEVVGKVDLWQMHEAQAEQCNINNIVARFQNGDITALTKVQGNYIDVSGMPKDLRGMFDMVHNVENMYNNLDPDIKSKFSDLASFVSEAGSQEWYEKLKKVEVETEDVKE